MFERFTDRARRVIVLAQEEARSLQHNYIGTEHLLLGLIREGEGVGTQVLIKMGVDVSDLRSSVINAIRDTGTRVMPQRLVIFLLHLMLSKCWNCRCVKLCNWVTAILALNIFF